MFRIIFLLNLLLVSAMLFAQNKPKPEDTEVWAPVPKVIEPGKDNCSAPSDAEVLFNGSNLDKWVSSNDTSSPAKWKIVNGLMQVDKSAGDIQTKSFFTDFQLHLEWRVPEHITGKGQARGNSGVFLAAVNGGGYELQIVDSYNNATYVNGQAGSVYKQYIPLVNPMRPPGEWQVYDIIWTAPRFNPDGTLRSPARITALFNGVVIQNSVELKGTTEYIGPPVYKAHGAAPIRLQSHGDPSEPLSFRNIWVRRM